MDFVKTLLAKGKGSEPDDTLIHIESPEQMPLGDSFLVQGWMVSQFEIQEVWIASGTKAALKLEERPDVAEAYPAYSYAKGFAGTVPIKILEGYSFSLQYRLENGVRSHKWALAINPLPSVRKKEKLRKLARIAPHLICPRCGVSLEHLSFTFEQPRFTCTNCGVAYTCNKSHFNFMTEALKEEFKIRRGEHISAHPYCPVALSIIARYDTGLILDCGAGRRDREYPNVVNFEIADFPSTDVIGVNERLPFRDETFDAVFSLAVLEHVKDPFRSAREISRVLKKGGILYCVVPFLQPLHGYPNHFYNMTSQGLVSLFEKAIEITDCGVPVSGLPISTLTWFLKSWAEGLEGKVRQDFLNMKVGDLIQAPEQYLDQDFVTHLPEEKNLELAGTTVILGKKFS